GKAKVTEEQVAHDLLSLQKHKKTSLAYQYIFQMRVSKPTGSFRHDESLYALLGQSNNEEESEKVVLGAEEGGQDEGHAKPDPDAQAEDQTGSDAGAQAEVQAGSNPDETSEGQAGSNPDETSKGQAGPNPGNAEAKVQSISSPVVRARSDHEQMDLDVADVSPQPSTEPLDEGPKSPKEHQQLKATTTDTTTTTTTLPPPQAPHQSTTEAMMVKRISELECIMPDLIQVNKDMEERLDSHVSRLYILEQLDIPQRVSIAVSEVVTDAIDWAMQVPLRNRFKDLPEADMKEILHQRMWESDSYKSHEDHMQLFEALEKLINRDHSKELTQDLAEARKKRKKSHDPSKTAASAEYQAWTTTDIRLMLSISLTSADLEIDEDMAPDEQVQSSDDEDIRSAHILTMNLRQGWWKPFEKERPTTLEPAWSIRSSDVLVLTNNWASALTSSYSPPPKDSLLAQTVTLPHLWTGSATDKELLSLNLKTWKDLLMRSLKSFIRIKPLPLGGPPGQVIIQSDFIFNNDLEYLRYGSKGRRPTLSISKMKAPYYTDAGLEQMRIEDFHLRIESYQTQVNLTKPQWTATGFEYKHDYIVIESPRAVIFRDKYRVQMMMRVNEIHKFNDGTLQQIDEALDYRVKEFRINRLNPGLNTRFWTRKDVDRCNAFMFVIQRRLRTLRIFCNLESFVGGRVREGDYRLLRRTD
nr:hypothetical protein [Tanacetum cinerariifolium]